MAKSRVVLEHYFNLWYRLVAQTGTKVHWYQLVITTGTKGPPKIAREPLYLWYRFFSQTGTKGFFSLFLFLFY